MFSLWMLSTIYKGCDKSILTWFAWLYHEINSGDWHWCRHCTEYLWSFLTYCFSLGYHKGSLDIFVASLFTFHFFSVHNNWFKQLCIFIDWWWVTFTFSFWSSSNAVIDSTNIKYGIIWKFNYIQMMISTFYCCALLLEVKWFWLVSTSGVEGVGHLL